ncbi:MAG: MFS transporter, partial [Bacteroidetes bacterium]|nr:MFS transporter [Bacteroidota bacterium]
SAAWSVILGFYAFTLPACPVNKNVQKGSVVDALGLRAFALFKEKKMCIFFIFSFLLGMCLQVTNGFATTYLDDFGFNPDYANAFIVKHNVFLSSISQISETLCILLIPFFLRRYGIKKVMIISFMAWFLRFAFLGAGGPEGFGLVLLILSMIVYGVAFDFFNISGSLFVDQNTDVSIRNSAQGVFMMMTNGFGATIGAYAAGWVVKHFIGGIDGIKNFSELILGWSNAWYTFAVFALVVGILFAIVFKENYNTKLVK